MTFSLKLTDITSPFSHKEHYLAALSMYSAHLPPVLAPDSTLANMPNSVALMPKRGKEMPSQWSPSISYMFTK